jgi:translocation and assembly module TamB
MVLGSNMATRRFRLRRGTVGESRQPAFRYALRMLLIMVLSLLISIALPLLLIHIPPVQNMLIQRGIQKIGEATGAKVGIGNFRWWPFSRLILNDLTLHQLGGESQHCDQVILVYRLRSTFPFFELKSLVLSKPILNIRMDSRGFHESDSEVQRQEQLQTSWYSRLPTQLSSVAVRVESGTVQIHRAGGSEPSLSVLRLDGHAIALTESSSNRQGFGVQIQDLHGELLTPQWGEVSMVGGVRFHDGMLDLDDVHAKLGRNSEAILKGSIALTDSGRSALDIRVSPWDWADISNCGPQVTALGPVKGVLTISGEGRHWQLNHWLESSAGKLQGNARWTSWGDAEKSLHWSANFVNLKLAALHGFPQMDLNGSVQVSLRGQSTAAMVGRLECRLDRSALAEQPIEKGELLAGYENGRLVLNSLDLRSPLGRVVAAANLDIAGLWDQQHQGEAEAKVEIDGLDLHRMLPAKFSQRGAKLKMVLWGRYGPEQFHQLKNWQTWMDLQVDAPKLMQLTTSGTYHNEVFDLRYSLTGSSLETLGKFYPEWAAQGQVESQGGLQGSWPDLDWAGSVTFKQLRHRGLSCDQGVIKGNGRILGKRATRDLILQAAGVHFAGQGLRSLQVEAKQQGSGCDIKLIVERAGPAGSLSLAASTQDLWVSPLRFRVTAGRLNWQDQDWSLESQAAIDRDEILFDSLKLRQDQQELNISGKLSWNKENRLQIQWDKVRVEKLLMHAGAPVPLSGAISGSAQLNGSLEQPKWSLECKLAQGKWSRETLAESVLKLTYGTRQLSINASVLSSMAETPINVSGKIPVNFTLKPLQLAVLRDEPWSSSLQVTGLKMENLLPYVPMLESVAGRMGATARIAGTLSRPEISGAGTWTDGRLQLKVWPHPAQRVHLEWQGDHRQVLIRNAAMDVMGGRATATGSIRLGADLRPEVHLKASAQQLEVPEIYGITGNGSGEFDLIVNARETKLSGVFQFSRAAMNLGEFESDLARSIQVVGDEPDQPVVEVGGNAGAKQADNSDQVAMDLELRTPTSGTRIRGKGLDAEVSGVVRLKKDGSNPLKVFGSLRSTRGTYTFHGQRLDIVDGELAFLGVTEPIPTLQVLAQKEVQGVTILIRVTGPLSQPKLLMSSIPAMNQVDILSYLVYGRPATQLSAKENQGLQQNAAFFFGSEASREFKKLLGDHPLVPDVLQVGSSQRGGGGVVEIGKYLTPDLYVTYEKGLTGAQGDKIQMEYRIDRSWSIQSQFGLNQPSSPQTSITERNQSGVDILWRHDFGD